MDERPINILAIEDNSLDVRLLRDMLIAGSRLVFKLQHEQRLRDGLGALKRDRYHVVLLDLMLPDCQGLATLDRVHAADPQMPIVVLTHVQDETSGLDAMRRGAQDYLIKGQFDGNLLSRAISYAIQRKQAEQAVLENIAERRILEKEVLDISAREQQRISQDLHDSVGQQLTGLSYIAKSLARKLAAKSLPEAEVADTIFTGIQRALGAVQNAIRGLVPVAVDANGLMVALGRLADSTRGLFGVDCGFVCKQPVPVEDNQIATHLYRIGQEATHNAAKHARAKHIVVSLQSEDDRLILEVRDDGTGMSPCPTTTEGMGLHIMRYRARAIGAGLEIVRGDGGGTIVRCTLDKGSGDEQDEHE